MSVDFISREETEIYMNQDGSADSIKILIHNGVEAVNKLHLWDWFRTYEPPADRGYMFDTHPNIDLMMTATDSMGHSGATFGITMRYLQTMAIDRIANPNKFKSNSLTDLIINTFKGFFSSS
jgi:hypothetical protein